MLSFASGHSRPICALMQFVLKPTMFGRGAGDLSAADRRSLAGALAFPGGQVGLRLSQMAANRAAAGRRSAG